MTPREKKRKEQDTQNSLVFQDSALGARFEIFLPKGWRASGAAASAGKKSRPKKRRPAGRRKR